MKVYLLGGLNVQLGSVYTSPSLMASLTLGLYIG